jgi:hypothetical protein
MDNKDNEMGNSRPDLKNEPSGRDEEQEQLDDWID